MSEIFVVTDIETDGPIPGEYSMLSLASVAYTEPGGLHDTFSRNLQTLPNAKQHPDTMKWWRTQPQAWRACRTDPEPPERAMSQYLHWVKALPGPPVFVAYPVGFDFAFVCWYLIRFTGENPYTPAALDRMSRSLDYDPPCALYWTANSTEVIVKDSEFPAW